MALGAAIERIFATIDAGGHVHDLMRAYERAAGRIVVRPGERPWLSIDDWHEKIVVSIDGNRVRLIAILAKHPGTGALTRTISGIIAAGLIPVIVEPTKEMRETCRRWGWKMRNVGDSFETYEEQWRPRFKNRRVKS